MKEYYEEGRQEDKEDRGSVFKNTKFKALKNDSMQMLSSKSSFQNYEFQFQLLFLKTYQKMYSKTAKMPKFELEIYRLTVV